MKIIFKNKFNSNGRCLFCTTCQVLCVFKYVCMYMYIYLYIYSHTYTHACICKWAIDQHKFELHGSTYVNFFHQIHTATLRCLNLINTKVVSTLLGDAFPPCFPSLKTQKHFLSWERGQAMWGGCGPPWVLQAWFNHVMSEPSWAG